MQNKAIIYTTGGDFSRFARYKIIDSRGIILIWVSAVIVLAEDLNVEYPQMEKKSMLSQTKSSENSVASQFTLSNGARENTRSAINAVIVGTGFFISIILSALYINMPLMANLKLTILVCAICLNASMICVINILIKEDYNMKKIYKVAVGCLCFIVIFLLTLCYCLADLDLKVLREPYTEDLTFKGTWKIDKPGIASVTQNSSLTYAVYVNPLPAAPKNLSYGAALNLRYFSGLSYDYVRKKLPGKAISLDVFIPKGSLSSSGAASNKLRICIKSETNSQWTEYYGDHEFTTVTKEGHYKLTLKIPEKSIETRDKKTFNPEDTALVLIEYYAMGGSKNQKSVYFSFSDFRIEGIDLHPEDARWQFVDNGYAATDVYVPVFAKGCTFIRSLGMGTNFEYNAEGIFDKTGHKFPGNLKDKFLVFSIFVPRELCFQPGTLRLTAADENNVIYSTTNDFHSCNLDGKVFLTVPVNSVSKLKITLSIKTQKPHIADMMPLIIEPMVIRTGRLIPFDNKWKLRDMINMNGSKDLTVADDGAIMKDPATVKRLAGDLYQLDATVRLQGGIDWKNPLYRVELMRNFENEPVDLDNQHIEVLINPLKGTSNLWQKPYRARVGLLDVNGNVMFGPNVSLSEDLPAVAYLDVSTTNPIPKGFAMPQFDPKSVKAILINFEASQIILEKPVDIQLSLVDLMVSPREYTRINPFEAIDFSGLKVDPSSWQLTRVINDAGGYNVGINYPFPVIKVPKETMEVPQIYPGIGLKTNDIRHFGYSSIITKPTMIRDFEYFVSNNINLTRIFVLGYLSGVFIWDERGKDIADFGAGREKLIQKLSKMDVKTLAKFLNDNEDTVFLKNGSGTLLGLEDHAMKDFIALLDILEQVEKDTGRRLLAIISLHDFLVADGISKEGPLGRYMVGEHSEIITDPLIKIKAEALLWKMMKILSRDKRFYKYIAMVEVMNEPENATAVVTRKDFVNLVNFVGENLYLVKDAIGPSVPVSIGVRSWAPDLKYWHGIGEGMDALSIHYWRSLESYDIDLPGLWPLDMPVSKLWEYLGVPQGQRLTGMGEISPSGNIMENLFRIEKAKYDFAFIWSYSGHDGFDAKPVMDKIAQYQAGNYKFAHIKQLPKESLENGFSLIFNIIKSINDTKKDTSPEEIAQRLAGSPNGDAKKTAEEIIEIIKLKEIPVNNENLSFLRDRSIADKK